MKKTPIVNLIILLFFSYNLFGQWNIPGTNPYTGPVNPTIERDNPYLIYDAINTGKSGLRFRTAGSLQGVLIFDHFTHRISFGETLNTDNAKVSINISSGELVKTPIGVYLGGLFEVGEPFSKRIVFDRNDIQALDTTDAAAALRLNHLGGNVNIGNGGIAYIAATDKTGIGTTSPKKRLDVNGDIALSNGVGSIDFYQGPDREAYINFNLVDLTIANESDFHPLGGNIHLVARKKINLISEAGIGGAITVESDGSFSPINLNTNEYQSHINLTTAHDSADINLLSEGDITLENTGTGNLNFITGDTMSLSTSGFQAPLMLSTNSVNSDLTLTTYALNSDINLEATGSSSDINLFAQDNFGDIELNAGSDIDFEAGSIIRFWNNDTLSMIINQSGKVGIGTSNPQFDMQVDGDLDITGEFTAASDKNLKKNISQIINASSIITALNPVQYYFKTDEFPDMNLATREKMGLIAQEVEQVLPNLVSASGTATNINGEQFEIKSVKLHGTDSTDNQSQSGTNTASPATGQ